MSGAGATARFAVAALATWRVTHLLASEDGPGDAVVRLRARLGSGKAAGLMDCFQCLSVWVAAPASIYVTRDTRESSRLARAVGRACLLERAAPSPSSSSRFRGGGRGGCCGQKRAALKPRPRRGLRFRSAEPDRTGPVAGGAPFHTRRAVRAQAQYTSARVFACAGTRRAGLRILRRASRPVRSTRGRARTAGNAVLPRRLLSRPPPNEEPGALRPEYPVMPMSADRCVRRGAARRPRRRSSRCSCSSCSPWSAGRRAGSCSACRGGRGSSWRRPCPADDRRVADLHGSGSPVARGGPAPARLPRARQLHALAILSPVSSLRAPRDLGGGELLLTAFAIWTTTGSCSALLFWDWTPAARPRGSRLPPRDADFQFTQDENPWLDPKGWSPQVWDYAYLSLTNAIAFEPDRHACRCRCARRRR